MAKRRTRDDEHALSSLEVLILAMLDRGLATAYKLREDLGLSLGATIPALRRLEEQKLVINKTVGRRHEFSLTPAGKRALQDSWKASISGPLTTEYEVVLRAAYLVWLLGNNSREAAELLKRAAKTRLALAEQRRDLADELRRAFEDNPNGTGYRWMRIHSEAARFQAEAICLETIAKLLPRRFQQR